MAGVRSFGAEIRVMARIIGDAPVRANMVKGMYAS